MALTRPKKASFPDKVVFDLLSLKEPVQGFHSKREKVFKKNKFGEKFLSYFKYKIQPK